MYNGKGRASLEPSSEDVREALVVVTILSSRIASHLSVLGDRLEWPEQGAPFPINLEDART